MTEVKTMLDVNKDAITPGLTPLFAIKVNAWIIMNSIAMPMNTLDRMP